MQGSRSCVNGIIDDYISDNFSVRIGETALSADAEPHRPIHGLIFILVISGRGTITTDGNEHAVRGGTLLSVLPFKSYGFTDLSDDFRYGTIAFDMDFMADFPLIINPYLTDRISCVPCTHLDRRTFGMFRRYYENIYLQYMRSEHPSRTEIVKACLYIFIAEVSCLYSQQTVNISKTHNQQITNDFFRLLHTFYRKERKPGFYASKLNLSPKYLTHVLKKVTGRSVYFWICDFVVKEARIMLNSRDISISQISDELNFPNSSYFARYFRKYTGQSPVEYRRPQ